MNLPRPGKRTDNGFEDRGGHQAPITLRRENAECGMRNAERATSAFAPHGLDDGVRLGEFSRLQLGVDFLSINADFETPAAGRHQRERSKVLFELQQFVRQTDGVRLVVSNTAVLDGNFQTHGNDGPTIDTAGDPVKLREIQANCSFVSTCVLKTHFPAHGAEPTNQIGTRPKAKPRNRGHREMSAWFSTLNWCR